MDELNKVIIYTASDGQTKIDVKLEDETLWLTQAQMCELYQTSRTNVVEHIKHIYEEVELEKEATCRNFRQVREEGGRKVEREMTFYNLDMIIALGYRVRSIIATRFRQWATLCLKEYMVKGFTLDDERLKKLGGGDYWKELVGQAESFKRHGQLRPYVIDNDSYSSMVAEP
ncbi:virulence RhuM family protein [Bacteroides sartorii]|nr:virulence RhuM family protein [Phocaeicola sartorii]